jgi:thiamine pyrophosphokinase
LPALFYGYFDFLLKWVILAKEQVMGGLLCTGGMGPKREYIDAVVAKADIVVAVDSGLELADNLGLKPDVFIGDMDSVQQTQLLDRLPEDRVHVYPQAKDYTDTELGLDYLFSHGYEDVAIVGGGGGRIDHFFGILSLFDRSNAPSQWIMHSGQVILIRDSIELRGLQGQVVSFFPVGSERCTMQSSGLKWPLDKLVWEMGDCGISNIVTDRVMRIQMITGRLILVRELVQKTGSSGAV